MVADDEGKGSVLHVSLDVKEMVEALIFGSVFRCLVSGEFGSEHSGNLCGVYHFSLGIARMHADALDVDFGSGGVEVFIFQLAEFASVHGVSPLTAELLHVEGFGTESDFFVGIEADAHLAVFDFGVFEEISHGLHDFGDAGFVIGTEEGGAIGDDEVFSDVGFEFGELLRRGDDALLLVQNDGRAIVGFDDAGLDVFARAVGAGVHVGDEPDDGDIVGGVCGEGGIDAAVVGHFNFFESERLQFVFEEAGEVELLVGGGCFTGVFGRLCVEGYVLEESFNNIHGSLVIFNSQM